MFSIFFKKSCTVFIILFAFCSHTGYGEEKKFKTVIFPFIYHLDQNTQLRGVEHIIQSELIRSGYFRIVDQRRTFQFVREAVLHNFFKIDDVEMGSEYTDNDIIDLFGRLEWRKVAKVTKRLNADYGIRGVLSQFGEKFRTDIEVVNTRETEPVRLQEMNDKTVAALVGECESMEKIPEMFEQLSSQIVEVCLEKSVRETVDSIVGNYYQGILTYGETAQKLEKLSYDIPDEFIIYCTLFSHYLEKPKNTKNLIKAGERTISLFDPGNEEHLRYLSVLGIDVFDELANAYTLKKDLSRAISIYIYAIKTYPMNHSYYYKQLGKLYLSKDKIDASLNAFKQTLSIDPTDTEARYNLASVYEKTGDASSALAHYKQCLKYTTNEAKRAKVKEAISLLESKKEVSEK